MILYVCQKAQDVNIQAITNSVFITSDNNILACLELYIVSVFLCGITGIHVRFGRSHNQNEMQWSRNSALAFLLAVVFLSV